ncbi:hypothetical protein ACK336_01080 [Aeromonas veronii]
MSTSTTLKLALELAAKVTGREDLAALAGEVPRMSDYAYRLIEPTSFNGYKIFPEKWQLVYVFLQPCPFPLIFGLRLYGLGISKVTVSDILYFSKSTPG